MNFEKEKARLEQDLTQQRELIKAAKDQEISAIKDGFAQDLADAESRAKDRAEADGKVGIGMWDDI